MEWLTCIRKAIGVWDLSCMIGRRIPGKRHLPGTICITEFSCNEDKGEGSNGYQQDKI